MNVFINSTVKIIGNITEVTNIFFKSILIKQKEKHSHENYGGFIYSDWEKIGNDMKMGLINFGRSK